MIDTKKPIYISTGMSNWSEIEEIYKYVSKSKNKVILMQCTSMYPTPIEKVGVNVLNEFHSKFNCNYGISDHSGSIWPSIY